MVAKILLACCAVMSISAQQSIKIEESKYKDDPFSIPEEEREGPHGKGGWKAARATWYGGPGGPGPDGMSLYTGSCGYGRNLDNHYVTAWHTDGGYDYGLTQKCGECYEIMCVHGATRGPGGQLGPWEGCIDAGRRAVTVKVTDSCPCHHPNSGNKRWCCGDMTHLDISYAAFDAIAERYHGVVDLLVRRIDCSTNDGSVRIYDTYDEFGRCRDPRGCNRAVDNFDWPDSDDKSEGEPKEFESMEEKDKSATGKNDTEFGQYGDQWEIKIDNEQYMNLDEPIPEEAPTEETQIEFPEGPLPGDEVPVLVSLEDEDLEWLLDTVMSRQSFLKRLYDQFVTEGGEDADVPPELEPIVSEPEAEILGSEVGPVAEITEPGPVVPETMEEIPAAEVAEPVSTEPAVPEAMAAVETEPVAVEEVPPQLSLEETVGPQDNVEKSVTALGDSTGNGFIDVLAQLQP